MGWMNDSSQVWERPIPAARRRSWLPAVLALVAVGGMAALVLLSAADEEDDALVVERDPSLDANPVSPALTSAPAPSTPAGPWRPLADAPLDGRIDALVIWTGVEVLVVGGRQPGEPVTLTDGAAYDPVADAWRRIAHAPRPAGALTDAGVWTGEGPTRSWASAN